MEPMTRLGLRWLLIIAASGLLLGEAVAYPQMPRCWDCKACGSSPDGSSIMCCMEVPC